MKKKALYAIALLLSSIVFANDPIQEKFHTGQLKGIVINPANNSLRDLKESSELKERIQQMKQNGYVYKESTEVKQDIEEGKNFQSRINDVDNPTDTHLKSDLSKIKLAFKYNDPVKEFIKPYGYSVGGGYLKNQGWTTIGTRFHDNTFGECEYEFNDRELSKGAILIPEEIISYEINKKVTTIFVKGSNKSGFMYNVDWDEEKYGHSLKCLKLTYDKEQIPRMIDLAKKIDSKLKVS